MLCKNGNSRSSAVASSIVGMKRITGLLGIKLETWEGTLSSGLRAQTNTSRVCEIVLEKYGWCTAKTGSDHTGNAIIVKSLPNIKLVD